MSKAGAFIALAIASAINLVFPVLEKYNTTVRMIDISAFSLYIIFVWKTILR